MFLSARVCHNIQRKRTVLDMAASLQPGLLSEDALMREGLKYH